MTSRYKVGERPWLRSRETQNKTLTNSDSLTSRLSKLDNARLKLSKLQQKYGKQETGTNLDDATSSDSDSLTDFEDEDRTGASKQRHDDKLSISIQPSQRLPVHLIIPHRSAIDLEEPMNKQVNEIKNLIVEKKSPVIVSNKTKNYQSENNVANQATTEEDVEVSSDSEHRQIQSFSKKSDTEPSLSEVLENVHSFSSLEIKEDVLQGVKESLNRVQSDPSPPEKRKLFMDLEHIMERRSSDSILSIIADSIESVVESATEKSGRLSSLFANVHLADDLVVSQENRDTPEIGLGVELQPRVGPQVVSIPVKDDTTISSPIKTLSQSSIQTLQKSPTQSSSPTIAPTSKPREIKPERRREEKHKVMKTLQRDAMVQTERRRSRRVQADLSNGCSTNTEPVGETEIRSCPVLKATILPPGLRADDDRVPIGDNLILGTSIEGAVEQLLNAQTQLTLNLLRRQHSLYINSCGTAARLEQGYRQETLARTRQFIRRERRLRKELRRS